MEEFISMVDYVLSKEKEMIGSIQDKYWSIKQYANFLKTPLSLGQFIACDLEGNVLNKPKGYNEWIERERIRFGDINFYKRLKLYKQYQEAEKRVLFKHNYIYGGESNDFWHFYSDDVKRPVMLINKNKTIKDLIKYNLTLK